MDALHLLLYIAHMIALVALVVGAFVPAQSGRTIQVWAARLQLLIGLGLVGVLEMDGASLNHTKIAVKLLVSLAVLVLAEIANGRHRRGRPSQPLAYGAAGLGLVNTAVAFLW